MSSGCMGMETVLEELAPELRGVARFVRFFLVGVIIAPVVALGALVLISV